MARFFAVVAAVLLALAVVLTTSSASANDSLSRVRRFKESAFMDCLPVGGVPDQKYFDDIKKDCASMEGFRYQMCALGHLAHLGQDYIKCVLTA